MPSRALPRDPSSSTWRAGPDRLDHDLLAALDSGHLSGALLACSTPTLPADHPYWRHPKVQITRTSRRSADVRSVVRTDRRQYPRLPRRPSGAIRVDLTAATDDCQWPCALLCSRAPRGGGPPCTPFVVGACSWGRRAGRRDGAGAGRPRGRDWPGAASVFFDNPLHQLQISPDGTQLRWPAPIGAPNLWGRPFGAPARIAAGHARPGRAWSGTLAYNNRH